VDVLSNVLAVTQMGKTTLTQVELEPPWGVEILTPRKAMVHVVRRGGGWMFVDGERAPIRLSRGDVVLVASGLRHAIVSDLDVKPVPLTEAVTRMKRRLTARRLTNGSATPDGDGQRARNSENENENEIAKFVCICYEFDDGAPHPFLAMLPKLIHLSCDEVEADSPRQAIVRLLLSETVGGRPGSELVVPRLVDTLFVFIVRGWIDSQPPGKTGWCGALCDSHLGRALGLIHATPERHWTVESLAREVALSRAAFASRFGKLIGEPPLAYLTRWRMHLAARLLRTTDDSVEAIAPRVGYDSVPAFGKAFRRHFRVPPGRYRVTDRHARVAAAAEAADVAAALASSVA
jgi:AraC-like DNA-binding protein